VLQEADVWCRAFTFKHCDRDAALEAQNSDLAENEENPPEVVEPYADLHLQGLSPMAGIRDGEELRQ